MMMIRVAMWGAILQRRYSEQEWGQMWNEKWNAAWDMANYVSQIAAQVMMSPQRDNRDAVDSVLQTVLTTLHVLEELEFDDSFPSSHLPPPYSCLLLLALTTEITTGFYTYGMCPHTAYMCPDTTIYICGGSKGRA